MVGKILIAYKGVIREIEFPFIISGNDADLERLAQQILVQIGKRSTKYTDVNIPPYEDLNPNLPKKDWTE